MTLPTATTTNAARTPALWALLFVLAGNMLIDALEVSVAIVALPAISDDLALEPTQSHWTVTGFAIGFGALILFASRLVTLLGRRRVYLAALLVFAAASLAAALADSLLPLVATRLVKGFCAALTAPTGLAIIAATFPEGRARSRAVSVYTLFGAGGFSAGLLLSGVLTAESWRWTFAFPAPVALLLFLCGLRLIPRDTPPTEGVPRRYDAAGAATLTGGTLLLVYAITSVPTAGGQDARTLGAFAAAALLFALFVRTELTTPDPLMRLDLLTHRPLVRSALGAAALNGSYLGLLLLSTVELQAAGWSPLRAALAFLPAAAPLALSALYSGRMVARFGPARLIALGAVFPPLGYVWYLRSAPPVSYAVDVLPTMLLVGAGFVLSFTALHMQATAAVPADRQAAVGGLYQTAVQMGAVLTLALVAALHQAGHRPAVWLITTVGVLGLLVALTGVRPRTPDRTPHRPPTEET